jgi:hypothetical protein
VYRIGGKKVHFVFFMTGRKPTIVVADDYVKEGALEVLKPYIGT